MHYILFRITDTECTRITNEYNMHPKLWKYDIMKQMFVKRVTSTHVSVNNEKLTISLQNQKFHVHGHGEQFIISDRIEMRKKQLCNLGNTKQLITTKTANTLFGAAGVGDDTTYTYGYIECDANKRHTFIKCARDHKLNIETMICEQNECESKPNRYKMVNSKDDTKYIICFNQSPVMKSCRAGQFFDGTRCTNQDPCHEKNDGHSLRSLIPNSFVECNNGESKIITCHDTQLSPSGLRCIDAECATAGFVMKKGNDSVIDYPSGFIECDVDGRVANRIECNCDEHTTMMVTNANHISNISNKDFRRTLQLKMSVVYPRQVYNPETKKCDSNINAYIIKNRKMHSYFLSIRFPQIILDMVAKIEPDRLWKKDITLMQDKLPAYTVKSLPSLLFSRSEYILLDNSVTGMVSNRQVIPIGGIVVNGNDAGDVKTNSYKLTKLPIPHFVYGSKVYHLDLSATSLKDGIPPPHLFIEDYTPNTRVFVYDNVMYKCVGNHILEYIKLRQNTDVIINERNFDEPCKGLGIGKLNGMHFFNTAHNVWCNSNGKITARPPCESLGFSSSPESRIYSQCEEQRYTPIWLNVAKQTIKNISGDYYGPNSSNQLLKEIVFV